MSRTEPGAGERGRGERRLRAALLTPGAPGALATVRVAGEGAEAILGRVFRPVGAGELLADRPAYGAICDGEDIIDHAIVTVDPDGGGCEIHTHGGPRIVQRVLELLGRCGAEVVRWRDLGEARSLAGEIELALPEALTRTAVLTIAGQSPGGLARACEELRAELVGGRADVAAVRGRLGELAESYGLGRRLVEAPLVALAGAVNAGKSTLANALTGQAQSLAAELEGTTRDWTEAPAEMGGMPVRLMDLPGQRETADPIELEAIAAAGRRLGDAELAVLVVEAGPGLDERIETQRRLLPGGLVVLVAVNKVDRFSDAAVPAGAVAVSALTGRGLDELGRAVAGHFGLRAGHDPTGAVVFTARQHGLIGEAMAALDGGDLAGAAGRLAELVG